MTDSYDISESTIRRILKKTKYMLEEDFEESTSQSVSATQNDKTIHQDNLLYKFQVVVVVIVKPVQHLNHLSSKQKQKDSW